MFWFEYSGFGSAFQAFKLSSFSGFVPTWRLKNTVFTTRQPRGALQLLSHRALQEAFEPCF